MVHIILQCSPDGRLNFCPTVARKLVFGEQEIGIECLQPEGEGSLQALLAQIASHPLSSQRGLKNMNIT
jgi:hypothetical protein